VLFIIDFFFDVYSAIPLHHCDTLKLLSELALPCSKGLWRANTRTEWELEYAASLGGIERYLTYGDLLNSGFGKDGILDGWLSQLDDFGTWVVAVASLPI
jgi:hypothetical protein